MGCLLQKENTKTKYKHLIEEKPKQRNNKSYSLIKKILEKTKSNPTLVGYFLDENKALDYDKLSINIILNVTDKYYERKILKNQLSKANKKYKNAQQGQIDPFIDIEISKYTAFPLFTCNGIRFNEFMDISFQEAMAYNEIFKRCFSKYRYPYSNVQFVLQMFYHYMEDTLYNCPQAQTVWQISSFKDSIHTQTNYNNDITQLIQNAPSFQYSDTSQQESSKVFGMVKQKKQLINKSQVRKQRKSANSQPKSSPYSKQKLSAKKQSVVLSKNPRKRAKQLYKKMKLNLQNLIENLTVYVCLSSKQKKWKNTSEEWLLKQFICNIIFNYTSNLIQEIHFHQRPKRGNSLEYVKRYQVRENTNASQKSNPQLITIVEDYLQKEKVEQSARKDIFAIYEDLLLNHLSRKYKLKARRTQEKEYNQLYDKKVKKFEKTLKQNVSQKDFDEFEIEVYEKKGFFNLLDYQLTSFQESRNLIAKIIWINKIMESIQKLLIKIKMEVEKKNFDIILSYWLLMNQEKYVNLENYIQKPLYCQIKIIKAFCKEILEEIMNDRFRMFKQIVRTFYLKKNFDQVLRFKQSPIQTDYFKNKQGS